jgi:hypothetical protein
MLAVTVALLAGASTIAVLSIRSASSLVQGSSQEAQRNAGMLVSVLATQTNSSGTFVWLYDYGWTSAPVKGVYVNGQAASFSSSCGADWSGRVCVLSISPPSRGDLTVVVGGISIAATV